jgi:exopolysaccharide production protein ExoQ
MNTSAQAATYSSSGTMPTDLDTVPLRMLSIAFYMLVFFVVIGTTPPFQPQVLDDGELDFVQETGSSAVNQIYLSLVYLLTLPAAYKLRNELFRTLRQEKWLTIFLIWCGITTVWSAEPVITLKRWIQLNGGILVCYCYVHYYAGTLRQLRPFMVVLAVFLVTSLVSVFVLGAAIDMKVSPPGWRGIAESKNVLGQFAVYSTLLWFLASRQAAGGWRISYAILLLISLALLFGSRSTTSQMAFFAAAGVGALAFFRHHLDRVGVGTVFVAMVLATALSCAASVYLLDPSVFGSSLESMGKDATFTGRTPLWNMVIDEANQHPLTGYGFGAFWLETNPRVYVIGNRIGWAAPHAHQGFLDILNETGYPGLLLLVWLLIVFFRGVLRGDGDPAWGYFVLVSVVLNMQESQLFRTNTISTVLFAMAYFAQLNDRARHGSDRSPPRGGIGKGAA